ncbi:MAG: hypothetical protein KBT46_08705 [Ruminococcus sp.]|nr:hypothetical protein [Candidatus Copronaster equi]
MTLDSVFNQFGQDICIKGPDNWSSEIFGGFVQPLRYKNKMYLNGVNTVIGFNSEGHYLYIGPPNHDLTSLDSDYYISACGKKFMIDRCEKVYFKNTVVYIWAIIREIVEVD